MNESLSLFHFWLGCMLFDQEFQKKINKTLLLKMKEITNMKELFETISTKCNVLVWLILLINN